MFTGGGRSLSQANNKPTTSTTTTTTGQCPEGAEYKDGNTAVSYCATIGATACKYEGSFVNADCDEYLTVTVVGKAVNVVPKDGSVVKSVDVKGSSAFCRYTNSLTGLVAPVNPSSTTADVSNIVVCYVKCDCSDGSFTTPTDGTCPVYTSPKTGCEDVPARFEQDALSGCKVTGTYKATDTCGKPQVSAKAECVPKIPIA